MQQAGRRGDEPPLGQSEVATRAYDLYQTAVREFFDTLPRHPMPLKLATDSLVVAIHGAVAVPMHLDTLRWSAGEKLASAVADTFIKAWVATANES